MFCRHCGKDNPPDARFCEQCGEELTEGFVPFQAPQTENKPSVQDTVSGVDRWANGFDVQPGDEEEPPRKGKKNPLPLVLAIVGAVVVLGVGGYFGWNFFQSQSMTGAPAETPVPVSQTESSLPEETETPVPTETPHTSESSSQEPVEKVQVIVLKEDRSIMNVPFVTGDADLDAQFVKEAAAAGFVNLKGHRTVGGMRASIYNAMPIEGVEKLVQFMEKFEEAHQA